MSVDTDLTDSTSDEPVLETIGEPTAVPDHLVEVRRRTGVVAALGAGASLVAVAYLARAAAGGGTTDWVLAGVLGVVGIANLAALLDSRTPLLVADELGVRLRLAGTWVGLPWGGLHEVELRPRRGWWRDGMLVVGTHYVQRVLEDLDPGARRTARLNVRLHRAPLAVPLGLGTRVVGAGGDLVSALRDLADGRTPVVERDDAPAAGSAVEPEADATPHARRLPDPRPAIAHLIGVLAARFERPDRDGDAELDHVDPDDPEAAPEVEPEVEVEHSVEASETPAPGRETVAAARAEVRRDPRAVLDGVEPLEEDTQVWGELHTGPEVERALLIDDYVAHAAPEPLIGPQLAVARERLCLSVDELADRTRIRPHVIEAIEVDDFSACGGDFYARGHLRTLARVLGVEGAPVLATYDERYADAPIDPRRVFEAELAGAGSIRATRGGPNWSVLVAAVMALVLCWSIARLVTGGPGQPPGGAVLSGSGGPNHQTRVPVGEPVAVTVTAEGGGARVVVRDGNGELVFSGGLAYGQAHTVRAATPVQVQSTDGSVRVSVGGQERGRMGPAGRPATRSYAARG